MRGKLIMTFFFMRGRSVYLLRRNLKTVGFFINGIFCIGGKRGNGEFRVCLGFFLLHCGSGACFEKINFSFIVVS